MKNPNNLGKFSENWGKSVKIPEKSGKIRGNIGKNTRKYRENFGENAWKHWGGDQEKLGNSGEFFLNFPPFPPNFPKISRLFQKILE